jgi:hypothetical protein
MDDSGLSDPELDPTHTDLADLDICRQQYGQMVTDYAKLVDLIKTELMKGRSSTFMPVSMKNF